MTLVTLSEFNWENIKQPGAYIEREPVTCIGSA